MNYIQSGRRSVLAVILACVLGVSFSDSKATADGLTIVDAPLFGGDSVSFQFVTVISLPATCFYNGMDLYAETWSSSAGIWDTE
jgi:hypothetical protein